MPSPWLVGPEPDQRVELRLFCLPFAGGAASVYRPWQRAAPPHLQVCPVELPGRGRRFAEPPYPRMTPLVAALAGALDDVLDRPYAVFGHSMGGLVGYELVRQLRDRGRPLPLHLFVSGIAPPGSRPLRPDLHAATDADVKRRLRELNGTPPELLENTELMDLMLPTLRADFSVLETYEHRESSPLDVPLTVFGGRSDPEVEPSRLHAWRHHAGAGYHVEIFDGDHFFVQTAGERVLASIVSTLAGPSSVPHHPRDHAKVS